MGCLGAARLVPFWCAAVALAVNGLAVAAVLSVADWHPSALVRMAASQPIAPLVHAMDPDFIFVAPGAQYDGVFYYAIAWDPLARGEVPGRIDAPAYRYGHPGYGWLAYVLSPRAVTIPRTLLAINLVAVAVGAFALAVLARRLDYSPWLGLGVALNPGVIYAVTADTSEALGVAVLALGLLAYVSRRWLWVVALLGYLPLIKEPFIAVPFSLAAWEVVEVLRGRRPSDWRRRVASLILPLIPFAVWQAHIRNHFGVWSFSEAPGNLGAPFEGWVDTLQRAATSGFTGDFEQMQTGQVAVPLLMATAGLLIVGSVRALRFRSPIDPVYLPFAAMFCVMTWILLLYPKELLRMLVVQVALLPFVFATQRDPGHQSEVQSPKSRV